MTVEEAYAQGRWGRAFGWRPAAGQVNPYTISGYHRGQDIRQMDPSESYSIVSDVLSLSSGVVSHTYNSTSTGREIVVDTGRKLGRYEIHCHNAPGGVAKGTRVEAGAWLARNATAAQQPGTAWSGPHDHFVISDYPDAAHANRPVYDPRDFIRTALVTASAAGAASGGAARPFTPESEEDDMYDTDAQKALFAKIEAETRPYRTYQLGSGLILMGPGGATWTIPSGAYQGLLIAWGLTSATVQRVIDQNELAALRSIHATLSPDPRDAQVEAILSLSDADVARIAAAVPDPIVTLTTSQLAQVAEAARAGGADAIRGLSFVVTAS